jgi:hypothetical protein
VISIHLGDLLSSEDVTSGRGIAYPQPLRSKRSRVHNGMRLCSLWARSTDPKEEQHGGNDRNQDDQQEGEFGET